MRALVVTGPNTLEVQELPEPRPGPYEVQVEMLACAFCNGTDRHLVEGTFPYSPPFPFVLGHESVGRVRALGPRVRYLCEGDVVLRPQALLDDVIALGWGGFADVGIAVDYRALVEDGAPLPRPCSATMHQVVPPGIPPAEATILITLKEVASALRATLADGDGPGPRQWDGQLARRGGGGHPTDRLAAGPTGPLSGQSVAVLGSGPVGFAFAECARLLGAGPIVVVGRREERLKLAAAFGADATVNSSAEDVAGAIRAATDGAGAALVVDAVGDRSLVELGLRCVRHGGRVGMYGVPPIPGEEIARLDLSLAGAPGNWSLMSINPDEPSTHELVCGWVREGKVELGKYVSGVVPLEEAVAGYERVVSGEVLKVVLALDG